MQFLPHDEKFFDLLVEQGRLVLRASNLLASELGSTNGKPDWHEMARKVRDLECQGDQATRNIYHRLHKTFITPVDPEDLHRLATLIDDILDQLDAVAYRFDAFGMDRIHERAAEIARMVDGCVAGVFGALEFLRKEGVKKPDESDAPVRRDQPAGVRDGEPGARGGHATCLRARTDPIALIKQKEIYELLEPTADCCENVADVWKRSR